MKIKEFQKELKKRKISYALLLRDDPNTEYFTGYKEAYCLIIPANKPAYILSSELDYERCRKESRVKTLKLLKGEKLFEVISKKEKGKVVGVNFSKMTLAQNKEMRKSAKIRLKNIDELLDGLRKIKTKQEIAIIKQGCRITDGIMNELFSNFKKFKTEKEIADFLRKEADRYGGTSFDPIVASGKKSSMPHSTPEDKKIAKGFCVIDYGIRYKGYCTDITRTVYVGKPTQKETEAYEKVLNVQEECIKMAKKGIKAKKLYDYAYKMLGKEFIHSLGHGIGVEIHEKPNISLKSKETLQKGMIFTIEPGIYYEGKFGIRIEDDVLVDRKTEVLTKTNKKLMTF
jgi:Xaa-Pro aminopeptidase